jgi:dUTP pyrophosphatase
MKADVNYQKRKKDKIMLLQVKVVKTKPNAKIPTWGSVNAAGADLYACLEQTVPLEIQPHTTAMIPLGIKTEFTPGYAAMIYARSGLASKKGLAPANKVGVIDADYRGEWMVALHNHSNTVQYIEDGERIAQAVFHEVEHPEFIESEELSETERGENGFGSTGTK